MARLRPNTTVTGMRSTVVAAPAATGDLAETNRQTEEAARRAYEALAEQDPESLDDVDQSALEAARQLRQPS